MQGYSTTGFSTLGNETKTTFLAIESHKMSQEFDASAVVRRGQPVKLAADGSVVPWTGADPLTSLLGYCYTDAAIGELVTVFVRGFMLIYAITDAALNAGPASYKTYDGTTSIGGKIGYSQYTAVGAGQNANAWNLDTAGAANTLVRILQMD